MTIASDAQPYAKGRFIYDADAHIVEGPSWLREHADPAFRERIPLLWTPKDVPHLLRDAGLDPETVGEDPFARLQERHSTQAFRDKALVNVMLQKQLNAFGAFRPDDRVVALDRMGFAKQLVINTFSNLVLQEAEAAGDLPLVRAMSRAHNRAIVEFCAADPRMMAAGYAPLSDLEQAATIAEEAVKHGVRAVIVASAPPRHSPTHVALSRLWAVLAEAKVPLMLHVGGTGEVLHSAYLENGREGTPAFHGGEGVMTSLRVLALPNPAKAMIAAMVMDGIQMQFPDLKIGVFELGASWLPSFLRQVDAVAAGFSKEPRIHALDRKPSDFIRAQVKVTPYPYEDAGWIVSQSDERSIMFSSDYPHFEGGRDPIRRFEASLAEVSSRERQRFYVDNFVDFVGGDLPVRATDLAA
jgi:predicted TIM-barrel fold metal-dependent hydrolase